MNYSVWSLQFLIQSRYLVSQLSQLCKYNTTTIMTLITAALWNRAGHYIFMLSFLSSIFFYLFSPRLISAVGDWMSTILPIWCGLSVNLECRSEMCCARLAENTARKKSAKSRHLDTILQLCWAISLQLRHVSTVQKKLVKQQYLLHTSP